MSKNEIFWKGFHAGGKPSHWPCSLNPRFSTRLRPAPITQGSANAHPLWVTLICFSWEIYDSKFSQVIFGVLLVVLYIGWIISYNWNGDGYIWHHTWHLHHMLFVRSCPLTRRAQNIQVVIMLEFLSSSTTLDWLHTWANSLGQKLEIGRNKARFVSCNCMTDPTPSCAAFLSNSGQGNAL